MAKIRNGFVSNSSSSSFIVQCKKTPESIDDLEEFNEKFDDIFGWGKVEEWDESEISSYKEYFDFAQKCWDDGDGCLFEWIDQNATEELSDIFDKMGLRCMFPEY